MKDGHRILYSRYLWPLLQPCCKIHAVCGVVSLTVAHMFFLVLWGVGSFDEVVNHYDVGSDSDLASSDGNPCKAHLLNSGATNFPNGFQGNVNSATASAMLTWDKPE